MGRPDQRDDRSLLVADLEDGCDPQRCTVGGAVDCVHHPATADRARRSTERSWMGQEAVYSAQSRELATFRAGKEPACGQVSAQNLLQEGGWPLVHARLRCGGLRVVRGLRGREERRVSAADVVGHRWIGAHDRCFVAARLCPSRCTGHGRRTGTGHQHGTL